VASFPHHGQLTFNHRILRAWRDESGLRPEEVCARAPMSYGYLRAIENGTRVNPSITMLTRLAAVYGHSVTELFDAPAGAR
jgi:transcriptional regulator with XRE-family HTH domain